MEHIDGKRLWELLQRAEGHINRLGAGGISASTSHERDKLGESLWEFIVTAERVPSPEPINVYSRREQRSA
jgi:hypothetical protein